MIFDPSSPVFNAIIFYILIISIILLLKPSFMYDEKTNKFKSFGCNDDQTIFSFPVISIIIAIILYLIFLLIDIFYSNVLSKL